VRNLQAEGGVAATNDGPNVRFGSKALTLNGNDCSRKLLWIATLDRLEFWDSEQALLFRFMMSKPVAPLLSDFQELLIVPIGRGSWENGRAPQGADGSGPYVRRLVVTLVDDYIVKPGEKFAHVKAEFSSSTRHDRDRSNGGHEYCRLRCLFDVLKP
jgi:hypothetical protein